MQSNVRATKVPKRTVVSGSVFKPNDAVVWQDFTVPGVEFVMTQSDEHLLRGGEAGIARAAKFAATTVERTLTSRLAYLRSRAPEHDLDRSPEKVHLALCLCGFPLYEAGGPNPLETLAAHRAEMAELVQART